jgi:rod shape-determining protein MreC
MARPRSANRRRFVVALIVLTSLTLITLDNRSGRTGPLGAVGRVAHAVVSPLQRAVGAVSRPISDWWSGVADAGHLKHENRTLRQQIAALEGRQRSASVALNQDKALKEMLGLGQQLSNNAKPVVARVVDRDPGNFESTITLDRGTEAGIDDGMAVLAPNGVVGDVIDSWHGGSKVRVLTDPASAIAVRTLNDPVTGIAQGHTGSRDLSVADFDTSAKVKKGDVIVTSDLANSVYPPDLSVGTVTGVDVQPAGLGLVVHINPYVDFESLEFVMVLRWVPGEGPVVPIPPSTTTTTTTTIPTSTSTTSSTSSTTPTSRTGP